MIQTKIENTKKYPPFLIKKEKNNYLLTQRAVWTKRPNHSLNNSNIIKINSCINFDSNRKNENIELIRKETNSSSSVESGIKFNVGRWTKEERYIFLEGMRDYGNDWKKLEQIMKTRSRSQIRSHAQKYFMRLKKKVKSQYTKFSAKNLINYVFNQIKYLNNGQITVNEKKRALNVIISNFRNFGKDEIESCNMIIDGIISSQKDDDKSTFYEKESNKNIVSDKNNIIIEINNSKNNDNIEDKKYIQENNMEFCNKKRKNSSLVNKIFQINKVIKYKYSNNLNEISRNSNRQIFGNLKKSKIKHSKNKFNNIIICPIINESYNIKSSKDINFNNKDNMNSFTNNNFNVNNNNINDYANFDMDEYNVSESLFDFGSKIKKNNFLDKFLDGVEFNDSLKSLFFEDSNREEDNDFSIMNNNWVDLPYY